MVPLRENRAQDSDVLPYENSLEHLLDELQLIGLLIHLRVHRFRMKGQGALDDFRGLYIKEEEIDAILEEKTTLGTQPESTSMQLKPLIKQLGKLKRSISDKKAASLQKGIVLRLERLKDLFQLSSFDLNTLLICLTPELDLRYERLYAYLQDDITKKRPSVDLVLNLLCLSPPKKLVARRRFTPTSLLIKNHLLNLFEDPIHPNPPLLSKYLKVDERVVNYLLGSDEIDTRLYANARQIQPQSSLEDLLLPAHIKDCLRRITEHIESSDQAIILYFQGPYGIGKQTTAEALCQALGIGLLSVDAGRFLGAKDLPFETALRLVTREALLQEAAIYWDGFDVLLTDDNHSLLEGLIRELEDKRGLTFLSGNSTWEPADALHHVPFLRIEFPRPNYEERLKLWQTSVNKTKSVAPDLDLGAVANKFQFSGGQIKDAATTARNLASMRDPENGHVTMDDLYVACRLQSNRKLAKLSQKIKPHYRWDDIILPPDQLRQLREICSNVKYRTLVYEAWGFDRKLSLGKGLNVLFAGPSGTGKTMGAEIIANELHLDLYKIDLSTVVSKYIGETEKNLSKIFKEAETSNAILFFDEADALFGKRSEVKDSHDRYANIEISYLLQRMDEYEGVVVLATNLRKNMDEAFVRRMHFTVDFPFPSEKYRRRIWEQVWPEKVPRSPEQDLGFMAQRFEIAGGNIRNIALAAAFLAANDSGVVNMTHLIRATQREYQKMGKLCIRSEFGDYYELIEGEQRR